MGPTASFLNGKRCASLRHLLIAKGIIQGHGHLPY